jgi:4-hydroxybenzoate polyprenyltransferase
MMGLDKFRAYMDLGRVQGVSLTAGVALIGAYTSTGSVESIDWFYFTVIAFFAHMAGASFHEFCDMKLDVTVDTLKDKPLVTGSISPRTALSLSMAMLVVSTVLTIYLYPILMATIFFLLSGGVIAIYNLKLKRTPGICEIMVPLNGVFYTIYGLYAVGQPTSISYVMIAVIFIATVFDQWINEMKDVVTDSRFGIKSVPYLLKYEFGQRLTLTNPLIIYALTLKFAFLVLYLFPLLFHLVPPADIYPLSLSDLPLYFFIFLVVGIPTQAYVIYLIFGKHTRGRWVKILVLDVESTVILGPILIIDIIGWQIVLYLILYIVVGYFIGSFAQHGAELKFGKYME